MGGIATSVTEGSGSGTGSYLTNGMGINQFTRSIIAATRVYTSSAGLMVTIRKVVDCWPSLTVLANHYHRQDALRVVEAAHRQNKDRRP